MSFADNRSELVDPWAWHAGPGGEPASVAARIDETGEDDVPAGAEDEPAAGADDEPVRGVDNEPGTADQEESATEPAVTAPANSAPAAAEAEAGVDTMAPQLDTTRLPSRFQADLMRAIFDATRDECVSVVEQTRTAGAAVVESVRQRGADEASVLARQAEEDQEAAAEWLRLETARLNEEHERRVAQRRDDLATELEAHEALVMRQVEATQGRLSDFEERMKAYVSRLAEAPDPAALVALAQEIPVPPTPDELGAPVEPLTSVAGAVVIPGEPDVETAVPDHTWTVLDAYLGPQMQEGDDEALFLGMGELGTYGEPVERTGPDQLEHEQHAVGEVEPHPLSEQSLGAWSGVLTALLGPQMKPDDAATMFGPVSAPTQEVAEDAAWPAPDARAAPAPEARAVDSPEARAVDAESWPGAARHADRDRKSVV